MYLGCVFGGGCVWRESLRAIGEVARKNLIAHLFCCVWMGAAVGSGWQVSVGSQGACPIQSRCLRMDGEAEKVFLSSGFGSGRVIWLIPAVIAVFIR